MKKAEVKFENITKKFNETVAVDNVSCTFEAGTLTTLLGPSGCGKTTMLNIVSGLVRPSAGRILFDDKDVTDLKTEDRNIAQVFQFPVIYNTMTVYENLAFPLKCRDFSKSKTEERVNSVAETLNLKSFLNSPARKLTADQKQLISLGRGLVREDVAAVLMDEPLTVIDPDLKFRLRRNLKEINEQYKTTLVYVTHDQNEAMTFADNIIVMDQGEVVQAGSPKDLFERPQTTFVGYFIGSPAMNLYKCSARSQNEISIGAKEFKVQTNINSSSDNLKLGIRSEYITVESEHSDNSLEADVIEVEDFGNYKLITASFDSLKIKAKVKRELDIPSEKVILKLPAEHCCIYENNKLI